MAYLTRAMLTARVGGNPIYAQLTDDEPDGGTPDTNVEALVLAQVDALIDGYARRGGYTTPLSVANANSVLLPLLDIANYKLRSRGGRVPSDDDRLQYENAMKILEMIGKGEWVFPSGANTSVVSDFGMDSYEQRFNQDKLSSL